MSLYQLIFRLFRLVGLAVVTVAIVRAADEPLPAQLDELTHYLLLAQERETQTAADLRAARLRLEGLTQSLATLADRIGAARDEVDRCTLGAGEAAADPAPAAAASRQAKVTELQRAEAAAIALLHDRHVLAAALAEAQAKVDLLADDATRTSALVVTLRQAREAALAAQAAQTVPAAATPTHGALPTPGADAVAPAGAAPRPPAKLTVPPTEIAPLSPAEAAHRSACPFCRRQQFAN